MRNFEDMIEEIQVIAKIIITRFGDQFDVNELVNEAWLKGRNYSFLTENNIRKRAKWDMLDYIRKQEGRDDPYFYKGKKVERKPKIKLLTNAEIQEKERIINLFDKPVKDENLLKLENEELLVKLLATTNPKETKAMFHYYKKGELMKEIGEAMNLNESRISILIKKGIGKCQKELAIINR